jgi:hypothetical protein
MEDRHITGSPEGREPVYVSNISYAVCAYVAGLPGHGYDKEEGMLTGNSLYRQLKPLCGVRAMRLWPRMTGGQRYHCGPRSSEEAGTWTLGRGDR